MPALAEAKRGFEFDFVLEAVFEDLSPQGLDDVAGALQMAGAPNANGKFDFIHQFPL